jgi:hypothetical protein
MLRLGDILEENSRVLSSAFAHHPPHLGQIGKASRFGDGETDEIDVVIGQQALEHPAAKIREPLLQGAPDGAPPSGWWPAFSCSGGRCLGEIAGGDPQAEAVVGEAGR